VSSVAKAFTGRILPHFYSIFVLVLVFGSVFECLQAFLWGHATHPHPAAARLVAGLWSGLLLDL
jgi:hypothetical protein